MIGTTLNHFKIIGRLGKGGMGEVYVAEDTRLKRRVALKVLPQDMANDRERLDRFQREAEAVAALNHPNVVVIHSVEESDGIRFITMELVEGKVLSEMIPAGGTDLETFFKIVLPVADALVAAHKKGIIHRDLKPANIMINQEGRVKILDFGLAKMNLPAMDTAASQVQTNVRTEAGLVMGTAPYMSPEQATGQDVDARSDIFSLGVILYQLACGRLPFEAPSVTQILAAILRDEPPRLDSERVPPELERIIRHCLEKDRDRRYGSVIDLAMDLIALRDQLQTGHISIPVLPESPLNNLPTEITTFIGRDHEVVEIKGLLSLHRLVTVMGSGGAGKTRLAFEAARRTLADYPQGVWQASLAPITNPDLVLASVMEAVGGATDAKQSSLENLLTTLKNRKLLLVLDNCEHVLDATAQIAHEILLGAPHVRILATSREALNVPGETVWTIPSLSFPSSHTAVALEDALEFDAIRLFVDRAKTRDPKFALNESNVAAVAGICSSLDGIPLAIELAAARVKVMSADEIRKRLNDCFKLLTGGSRGALHRHQTLRAAVDWSFDLLSAEERLLFSRLCVFMGSFDVAAVENVCGFGALERDSILDHLSRLVDKSLIICERSDNDVVRHRLLEPLRQYAAEKLKESGEASEVARRHFSYYANLADRAYDERTDSASYWLDQLERDHDNLRAALAWAAENNAQEELRLSGALAWFWFLHSHFSEGRHALRRVLRGNPGRTREAARALCGTTVLDAFQGVLEEQGTAAEEGLAIWRELDDKKEIALALESVGWHRWFSGNNQAALEAFEESLSIHQTLNDERLINRATLAICQVLVSEFDVERAEPMAQRCLPIAIRHDEPRDIHFAHHFLADCALIRGEVEAARSRYADSLRAAIRIGDKIEISFEIEGIAMALAGIGRDAKAIRLIGAVLAQHEALKADVDVPFWEELKRRYLGAARDRLGAAGSQREERIGRKMAFDKAIEYALDSESDESEYQ